VHDVSEGAADLYRPVEVQQALPALGLEVLDILRLVQNQVAPRLSPERLVILQHQLVGSDAHVESIRLCPALKETTIDRQYGEFFPSEK